MAITNKEILEEIEKLKKKIPTANGDFILLKKTVGDLEVGQSGLKDVIKELKERLLNPDNGVITRVNRNSDFRKSSEQSGPLCKKSFEDMEDGVQELTIWRQNVTKVMWLLVTGIIGLGFKVIFDWMK